MTGRRRLADERGQLLILTAVIMLSLLSIMAFSINVSYAYDKRNKLYAAADAAAKIGAVEVFRDGGVSQSTLEAFANQQVTAHGFTPVACGSGSLGAEVCINHPPANGPFSCGVNPLACQNYVEAIVSEVTPTFFGSLLGRTSLNPRARSVAGSSPSFDCIVVFDDMLVQIGATGSLLNMPNCTISVGGNFTNRANIVALGIGVKACITGGSNLCTYTRVLNGPTFPVVEGIPMPLDPLAKVPSYDGTGLHLAGLPDGADDAFGNVNLTADRTIHPAIYHNIHFAAGAGGVTVQLTLLPGNYYITGLLDSEAGGNAKMAIVGDGVMLYLAQTATVNFQSNQVDLGTAAAPLSAAATGPYNGILFYQDRATPTYTAVFGKNNTNFNMAGAFYFKTATLKMDQQNNNAGTNTCTLIVAKAIDWGKPVFSLDNSCPVFNGSPLLTVTTAE
jgi:hypothetical protein